MFINSKNYTPFYLSHLLMTWTFRSHFRFSLVLLVITTYAFAALPPYRSISHYNFPSFRPHGQVHRQLAQKSGSSRCSRTAPCSETTLTLRSDTPTATKVAEKKDVHDFLKHFAAGGFNLHDVVELGRDAAWFFKKRFGIDFTRLSPDSYLYSGHLIEGVAAFRPFMFDTASTIRLTSVIRKDRVQFFNKRMNLAGWRLFTENDYVSRGTFNGTLPKRARVSFASFMIRPCEGEPYGQCKNILRPEDPAKPIFIMMSTLTFFDQSVPSEGVELTLNSPYLGKGHGLGSIINRDDGYGAKTELVITLVFPGNKH